jgi:uncharacterized protein with HEPN domain
MSKHDAAVTLRQIADFARQAQKLCEGHTLESFMTDWKGMLALERVMELIGESVKRLPDDLRDRHPQVDWKAIAGMRDQLSHGKSVLMGNPISILWNAVHKNVPGLLRAIEQMSQDLKNC